jgi:hypothetical protein
MKPFIKYGVVLGCLFFITSSKGFCQSYFDGNMFSGYEKALEAYKSRDGHKNIKIAKSKKHHKIRKQKNSELDTSNTSNFIFNDFTLLMADNNGDSGASSISNSLSCTASLFLEFNKKIRLRILLC